MNLECKVFYEIGKYYFDILDNDDTLEVGEEVLPECIYTSTRGYANESTADRNGSQWIKRFNKAGDGERRRLCGYDGVAACRYTPRSVPVLRSRALAK